MKRVLVLAVAIATSLGFVATATAAPIFSYGDQVTVEYYYPTFGTVPSWGPTRTAIVGSGVEFVNKPRGGLSLDFSPGNIFIDYHSSAAMWINSSFNGLHIYDSSNSLPSITGVDMNGTTNMLGLNDSRITFDSNNIWVNWRGLSFNGNTIVSLDVNGGAADPDPSLTTNPGDGGTVDFGNTLIDQSNTANISATNTGDSGSSLNGSFGSPDDSNFTGGGDSFSLNQGENTSDSYTFTPTERGGDSANVTVTSDGGDSSITLQGQGVAPLAAEVADSGVVQARIGGNAESGSITIENTGNGNDSGLGAVSNLNGSVDALSTNGFDMSDSNFSLQDGQSTDAGFGFQATARGTETATAVVNYDNGVDTAGQINGAGSQSVTLNGQGVGPELAAAVDGSTVAVDGTTLVDMGTADWITGPFELSSMLTITNDTPDGDLGQLTDLSLLGFDFLGADSDMFDLLGWSDGIVLGAGESIDFEILFSVDGTELNGVKFADLQLLTDQNAAFGADGDVFVFGFQATQTPEPFSLALWSMLGAVGFGYTRLRRRK